MNSLAIMATFPARHRQVREAAASIAHQVDTLVIVANEYSDANALAEGLPVNATVVIPTSDLKDTGKFYWSAHPDDLILLVDDDISYPSDYRTVMEQKLKEYEAYSAVVGLHGTIFSDFYEGGKGSRLVYSFRHALDADRYVNQLGTGTVACFGRQLPEFEFMEGSERFVDVRFARHCHAYNFPRICISRPAGWALPLEVDESIYDGFTNSWPGEVVREVNEFGGFRRLPALLATQPSCAATV